MILQMVAEMTYPCSPGETATVPGFGQAMGYPLGLIVAVSTMHTKNAITQMVWAIWWSVERSRNCCKTLIFRSQLKYSVCSIC